MKSLKLNFNRWLLVHICIHTQNIFMGVVILSTYINVVQLMELSAEIDSKLINISGFVILAYLFGASLVMSFISFLILCYMWNKR